jgi:hypothetical protein
VDDVLLTNPFPSTSIRGCIILWPCIDLRARWISSAGTPVTQGKWLPIRQLKESGIEKDCERHGYRPLDSTPFSKILSMVSLSSYYASAAHENRKKITGEGFSSATDCLVCSPYNSITWVLSRSGVCVCVCVSVKKAGLKKKTRHPSLVRSITMDPAAGKSLLNSQRSRPALVE